MLDWSRNQLAEKCGFSLRTVLRFEAGDGDTRAATIVAIRGALEAAGVIFVDENGEGAGVRLKKPSDHGLG